MSYPIYNDNCLFSVSKHQLPIVAELIINHLRCEAMVERQHEAFDIDDAPHVPSTNPLSNPQSRRAPVHLS